ncbi:HD-GYP domain, c-di-GMP phosphodiesterase class II (or its inactivated variant) [Hathewaya proteolytica DSM 3090]|uniref:HD-GYP domain, c-di-GMP phosphodiesterase class II (Or its inactivated variant) n=1 Tax=Hathewaya proteolytica DSM 3090 TaxID=1121331 RepID=A0A1M6QNN6_9CLOT|nr:HD-GYP domain-containing protein [Hathewaya proteolytica]SHK21871.1 HD-GYP domain, c-di-GMP phosphodiesterase class II (or its inactivated variant) [Hathewaya proteolytica DSM 3090]
MKIVLVDSLKGNEKLSYDVTDPNGAILIKAGTVITNQHIKKLQKNGIYAVRISGYEDAVTNYKEKLKDEYMENLKYSTLKSMPAAFQQIVESPKSININQFKNDIFKMVDHILECGSVTTNLFEIKDYDDYTYVHCVDTCIMSIFLGMSAGLGKNEIDDLALAAILHDIGKIKIPNSIINKKGRLTDSEFEIIKTHPSLGEKIVADLPNIPDDVCMAIGQHHERFDGRGYPHGIVGKTIHPYAKIISVCDVFTAVSANRSYRPRFEPFEAYELILSGAGSQFDPKLISRFKDNFAIYPIGSIIRLSNGMSGIVVKQNKGFPDRPVIKIFNMENSTWTGSFDLNLLDNIDVTVVSSE